MQNLVTLQIKKINNGVTFQVKVIPNSSVSKIVEITEEFLKIKLNSPPIENKANKEVVTILSKTFGVPKSSVKLMFGDKNKLKTFWLPLSEEELRTKLTNLFN